jgi:formylglycine-generating enzyme
MKLKLSVALFIVAILPCAAAFATITTPITIETVPVGNPGNANDPATGNLYGSVNYAYSIGKYEVTVGQYVSFLNAVAATDTYGLYETVMAYDIPITRNGTFGSYTYSLTGSPNRPIIDVNWGDAARFANWLHNGQPTGPEDVSTTEDGAYKLNGATTSSALISIVRNPNAKWFIPSENEWYKAAYYQPAALGGDSDNYWKYPMRTNNVPYSDQPPGATPDNTRVGNFYKDDALANGYDDGYAIAGSTSHFSHNIDNITDVGAYNSASSYYGTFDQGGNVWEWNEAVVSFSNFYRGKRGSSWYGTESFLPATYRTYAPAAGISTEFGFRVASIPEPSTAALIGLAAVALFTTRGRRV